MLLFAAVTGLMAQSTETKNTETEKEKCKARYKLSTVSGSAQENSGYLILQFDFALDKNSDIPSNGTLSVKLTNCKGEAVYVKAEVKIDPVSGRLICYQAIPQSKECPLSVAGVSLQVKDECGGQYGWCGQVESNNKGTLSLYWSGKHIDKGTLTCY